MNFPSASKRAKLPAMALAFLAALPPQARAQVSEYELKAAFLSRFAEFVTWPSKAFSGPGAPIVIGVMGDDPFGGALEREVKGKTVSDRKVVIRRVRSTDDLKNCHIAFISNSERSRFGEIVASLGGTNVLTVGDTEQFAQQGGAIGFKMIGAAVRFEINNGAAQRAGLALSSRLLKLGRGSQ